MLSTTVSSKAYEVVMSTSSSDDEKSRFAGGIGCATSATCRPTARCHTDPPPRLHLGRSLEFGNELDYLGDGCLFHLRRGRLMHLYGRLWRIRAVRVLELDPTVLARGRLDETLLVRSGGLLYRCDIGYQTFQFKLRGVWGHPLRCRCHFSVHAETQPACAPSHDRVCVLQSGTGKSRGRSCSSSLKFGLAGRASCGHRSTSARDADMM